MLYRWAVNSSSLLFELYAEMWSVFAAVGMSRASVGFIGRLIHLENVCHKPQSKVMIIFTDGSAFLACTAWCCGKRVLS